MLLLLLAIINFKACHCSVLCIFSVENYLFLPENIDELFDVRKV